MLVEDIEDTLQDSSLDLGETGHAPVCGPMGQRVNKDFDFVYSPVKTTAQFVSKQEIC